MSVLIPQELIRIKRDGGTLKPDQIQDFIAGLTRGDVSEAQAAAFAMAVFFNGLDAVEQAALTQAMTRSGTVMTWDNPSSVVDKHSTGGVGDKVSLILAPIVAACGCHVPMISGRGLGHTGGTLDKFSAIPGYDVAPGLKRLAEITKDVGCAVIGQTEDLAPADKRLYAIRDVTGTVESIHLITASILSKKLAAGLNGLIMDVKVGNGAFMTSLDEARALARNLVRVANEAGMPTRAVLTDMNQVLGTTVGNALEVREAVEYLTGRYRDPRLHAVTIELAAHMLVLGQQADNLSDARSLAENALETGAAADKFAQMVEALGGPSDFIARYDGHLDRAPVIGPVPAQQAGYLTASDTRGLGVAVIALGGGRRKTTDKIDDAVGLSDVRPLGSYVKPGDALLKVHARTQDDFDAAVAAVQTAFTIGEDAPDVPSVLIETMEDSA